MQIRGVIRGLWNMYPTEPLRRILLMYENMCAIRNVMALTKVKYHIY